MTYLAYGVILWAFAVAVTKGRLPMLTTVVVVGAVPVFGYALVQVLGLDPGYVACEGRFVAFSPEECAQEALGPNAAVIGNVIGQGAKTVIEGSLGVERRLQKLSGEQLPRIC